MITGSIGYRRQHDVHGLPAVAPPHGEEIVARLRKATGQLAGVQAMYENGRYCIDILDQLAAATAAIDGIALLVLEDHIATCVRTALAEGDADDKTEELIAAVRRYVRTR